MKIERQVLETMTLEEFADKYGLVMEVRDRDPRLIAYSLIGPAGRFYASFKRVEEKDGYMLRSSHGNGHTEEEAIANYVNKITGKDLVLGAHSGNRIDISATHITFLPEEE